VSYLLLKWIHILSATILFGTGIGSAFYMFMANRQGKIEEIYFATRIVVLADTVFTAPAVIIQLITGMLLVHMLDYSFTEFWVAWGIGLYFFAGVCWLPVVWMQIRMRNMAEYALESGELLPELFWKMDRWWIVLGSLAFPALVGVFYLMVFKPADLTSVF
jgi:uncharacterized membrane protein